VADQRSWQEAGLAEDLEPVADAEDRRTPCCERRHLAHHRSEPGDRVATEVVPVAEPTRKNHGVDAVQVRFRVPERDGRPSHELDGAACVGVVQRTRERHDADVRTHGLPSTIWKSSITGFAKSFSAISWTCSRAEVWSGASSSK